MKTRYLPVVASLLLIAIAMTSFMPVFAQLPTRAWAQPTLTVKTIAEDDEARQTGVMWMGDVDGTTTGVISGQSQLLSQFKLLISYNGQMVYPDNMVVTCQFVEKDKVNPLKPGPQFAAENLVSKPVENDNFACKVRWGKPGVGVIDVYYIGALDPQYVADYILAVSASFTVGHTVVLGTEIQDICLLAWPMSTESPTSITLSSDSPNGDTLNIYADPLGTYVSCEDAALVQQHALGLQILWQ